MSVYNKQPEWRSEHIICSYDVDPQQTARLPALCRFMQEAAYHHAEHLGLGHALLAGKGLAWVLARQRIEAAGLPKWGDTVCIRTWPSGRDKLFFYRDFEITDRAGTRLVAASNAWSLIDLVKRERVHPEIYLDAAVPEGAKVLETRLSRLKGGAGRHGFSMPVTCGDLDLNGHVNNVRYIEWILNGLPLEFHERHLIKVLECNYLAEAVCGQSVSVCCEESGLLEFSHSIRSGEMELFRARSVWEEAGV